MTALKITTYFTRLLPRTESRRSVSLLPRPHARSLRAQSQEIAARTTELEDALAQLDARRRELERLHGESKAIEGLLLEAQKLRARAADIEETVRGNAGGAGAADEDQARRISGC